MIYDELVKRHNDYTLSDFYKLLILLGLFEFLLSNTKGSFFFWIV